MTSHIFYIAPTNDFTKDYFEVEYHDSNHPDDSGVDIPCPSDLTIPPRAISFKIPLGVKGALYEKVGDGAEQISRPYWLLPRSSMGSKTPLRTSNSLGLIDKGYRGELTLFVDNVSDEEFKVAKGTRLVQICEPHLEPCHVTVVEKLDETVRGERGFGSTGN